MARAELGKDTHAYGAGEWVALGNDANTVIENRFLEYGLITINLQRLRDYC